jgi:signal transduction histidine kinase
MIHLEVQDWGCGFDPLAVVHELSLGEHVGLREMQERVELVNGHFMISSRQGAGTIVVADVPLLQSDARSMYHE